NTHSDDIGAYIRWLSIFTYWAIGFGVCCGVLTFLPDEYVFVWILSSIPFYVYLYCCYQNYMLFYERVETAIREDIDMTESDAGGAFRADGRTTEVPPTYHSDFAIQIRDWIDSEGYCKPGLTLKDLSTLLCTNRTYLSEYIHTVYHVSFRDWIADLRIEHSKQLMRQKPQMKIFEISEACGFLSLSHFTRTFNEKEGCLPSRWRKNHAD
ncbi:MAG: helix-turn-helix domain-containing protein, partial [Prevotella sp.]